jgi:hypothetical protein
MGSNIQEGMIVAPLTNKEIDAASIPRGSVTDDDWLGIVRSIIHAGPVIKSFVSSMGTVGALVEIGTLAAKTTSGIVDVCNEVKLPCRVYSIDKQVSSWAAWERKVKPKSTDWVFPEFLHGCSWEMIDKVKFPICWAFVDGCHCAECVCYDISAISGKMPSGGVIAFHDACDQRSLGMKVHERYHGDGIDRLYGVTWAIENSIEMKKFELIEKVKARKRPKGPTPIFGGLQVWRKK